MLAPALSIEGRKINLACAVKYFSPTTNTAIIRVAREQHKIAWGGVTLLSAIEGRKCLPNVICVSGGSHSSFLLRIHQCSDLVQSCRHD